MIIASPQTIAKLRQQRKLRPGAFLPQLTENLKQVDKYFGCKLEAGGPPGKGPGSGHYEHQKHFQSQMLTNLKVMSRTSHGTAREANRPGLTHGGDTLAQITEQNFKNGMDWIWQHKSDPLDDGKQVRHMVETLGGIVSKGLLQPGQSVWRTWDDSNYIKPQDIQKGLDTFSQQLSNKLKSDPIDTAGWVEKEFQHVHPLADGVGRTTMLLAALVLARGKQQLPQYRDRKEYFAAMNSDTWPAYYRTLFSKKVAASSGQYQHVATYRKIARELIQPQLLRDNIQHIWKGKELHVHADAVEQHGSKYGWTVKQQEFSFGK